MDLTDILFGCILGVVAGIIPGIHSNTFASILLFSNYKNLWILIISSAIAYTIADIIPTTILGVPDEETAIGILPSHRMVLEGRGFEAIFISTLSSFLSLFICIPLMFTVLVFKNVNKFTPLVLLAVSIFMILSERGEDFEGSLSAWRKRLYAFLIFLSSGFLGFLALENSYLAEISFASSIFLPLLSGLFASPVLLLSSEASIPKQTKSVKLPDIKSVVIGSVAGFFVSVFPGISSGVATTTATLGTKNSEEFICAMSSANTANALLCFASLIYLGKIRSGASDALNKIGHIPNIGQVVLISIISGLIALIATIAIAYLMLSKIHSIKPKILSYSVFAFLTILVYYLTGFFGLAVFLSAIPIGLSCSLLGVRRVNCMGCLIIPIMFNYL